MERKPPVAAAAMTEFKGTSFWRRYTIEQSKAETKPPSLEASGVPVDQNCPPADLGFLVLINKLIGFSLFGPLFSSPWDYSGPSPRFRLWFWTFMSNNRSIRSA